MVSDVGFIGAVLGVEGEHQVSAGRSIISNCGIRCHWVLNADVIHADTIAVHVRALGGEVNIEGFVRIYVVYSERSNIWN